MQPRCIATTTQFEICNADLRISCSANAGDPLVSQLYPLAGASNPASARRRVRRVHGLATGCSDVLVSLQVTFVVAENGLSTVRQPIEARALFTFARFACFRSRAVNPRLMARIKLDLLIAIRINNFPVSLSMNDLAARRKLLCVTEHIGSDALHGYPPLCMHQSRSRGPRAAPVLR